MLKRYVRPGNSLLQFAKQYTALQQKILGPELQQEATTALKQLKLLTYLPMERQMSKIYTNKIFNKKVSCVTGLVCTKSTRAVVAI